MHFDQDRNEIAAMALGARQFELLVKSVRDYAIFALDLNGVIRTWNPGAERLKGYREAEIIGQSFHTFYSPEDRAAGVPARLLDRARVEGQVEAEGWRLRKDGTRFWADTTLSAIRDDSGALVGFAKITRDLTERKASEEAIAQKRRELEALNAQLLTQAEALEAQKEVLAEQAEALIAADKLKDQFLTILSHEMRTPLNAVLGFASILEDGIGGELSASQRAYLAKITAGTDVLLGLINDLLDMSRVQAGKFSLALEPADLAATLNETVSSISALAERKGLRLVLEAPPDLPAVQGDTQRLAQIVLNLVGNAMKFTPPGGEVVVRALVCGGRVRVEVQDDGPGIAPVHQERLFEPFFQADHLNARNAGGSGLGLSIARALVEAHRGRIGLESTEGRGSTFWFEIPIEPQPPASPPAAPSAHTSPESSARPGPERS